jgi:hypothetical protein
MKPTIIKVIEGDEEEIDNFDACTSRPNFHLYLN